MKVHVLILGNIDPLSGCEFKNSKALEIITTRLQMYVPDFATCKDQPAHRTVLSRTKH